jgi:glycosyltransferase involved in cell wall biosynthesis
MIQLSILIPTIKRDKDKFRALHNELCRQWLPKYDERMEICVEYSETETIGTKRNKLLDRARGKYLVFIDSDDWISADYLDVLFTAIGKDVDCCSLRGQYSKDGVIDGIFEHSTKYSKWETVSGTPKYLRYPNHLNMIRSSIAKQFRFPETSFGEDHDWSTQVFNSKLIKSEYYYTGIIYYYNKVTHVQPK